jgi:Na+/melibiose symporter-like transporter
MNDYKSQLKQMGELVDESSNKFYSWYKQILLMASGLISILVSLHSKTSNTHTEHIAYIMTIGGLALGILSGSILLFSEVHNVIRCKKEYSEQLSKMIREKSQTSIIVNVKTAKIFVFFEWLSYICFVISLCSLVYYSILSDM